MTRLSKSAKRIMKRYSDPKASGYFEAMVTMPYLIKLLMGAPIELSTKQEDALIAVSFLDVQADERNPGWSGHSILMYMPDFLTEGYGPGGPGKWITKRILDAPGDPMRHWKEYRARIARSEELRAMFGFPDWNYDPVCDYSEAMITRLREIQHDTGTQSWDFWNVSPLIRRCYKEADLNDILELGERHVDFVRSAGWTCTVSRIVEAVRSLHFYDLLPQHDYYSKAPADVRSQCDALIALYLALCDALATYDKQTWSEIFTPVGTLIDQRTASLCFAQPECAKRIAAIIVERRTTDYDTITHLFNTSTGSILDTGIL
jgi:hypothetical protein